MGRERSVAIEILLGKQQMDGIGKFDPMKVAWDLSETESGLVVQMEVSPKLVPASLVKQNVSSCRVQ